MNYTSCRMYFHLKFYIKTHVWKNDNSLTVKIHGQANEECENTWGNFSYENT